MSQRSSLITSHPFDSALLRSGQALSLITVCALLFSAANSFAQGSLTPPGSPAPTFKTLDQVEPRIDLQNAPASAVDTSNVAYHFIINQPGSYYLSANLGVAKTNGIQINAEGVTLDLNGFQISGAFGNGGSGIEISGTSHRASIRNGSIKGFSDGVSGNNARACGFRDLAVSNSTNHGISAGEGAVLEACRAHDNSGTASIQAGPGSTLANCTASNNTLNNIGAQYGIFADTGSSLTNCSASNNFAKYGIFTGFGSSLTNCSAVFNTGPATSSTSAGIGTDSGCTITHCSAYQNTSTAASTPTAGMGFFVGSTSTIQGCTASFNKGDGIRISTKTVARDNTCSANGNGGDGAGIHSNSDDNRIEGNNVTGNKRGIDVDGTGSLIIRNSSSGNTGSGTPSADYDIAAGNFVGTIVTTEATMNSATNSNINISY
jgi:parallel beta-helix repeat protein